MKSFCSKALAIAPVLLSFASPSYSVSEITPVIDVQRAEISSPGNGISHYENNLYLTSHPIVAISRHENISGGQSDYIVTDELYEWLLYPQDQNLILLGGKESNFGDIGTAQSSWTIPTPVDFQIDGTDVDELIVYNHGLVEVISSSEGVLAWASIAPDLIEYRQNDQTYNLISVRTRESIILVTYELKSHANAPSSWSFNGQIRINTELPSIGHKLDKSSFDDSLFNLTSGEFGCEIRHEGVFHHSKGTPAALKERASEAPADFQSNTSNVCEINGSGEVLLGFYNDPSFEDPEIPEFERYDSAETTRLVSLNEGVTYTAVLRQHATGLWGTGISDWSEPVNFFTAGNVELQISLNGLSGENAILEVPGAGEHTISVQITNTGEAPVRPVFSMFVGENSLENVPERVSLFSNFNGDCAVKENDSGSIECTSNEVIEPGESTFFEISTLITEEQNLKYYTMSACSAANLEVGNCHYTNFEVRVGNGPETDRGNDSGSSGGGAMFWLTLLALPLLRLRRKA